MNIEWNLKRVLRGPTFTDGLLWDRDEYLCDTLEDQDRDLDRDGDNTEPEEAKVFGKTAIPDGRYQLIVDMSNKFKKRMILVVGVKGFSGVRLHRGQIPAHTEGCILAGERNGPGKLLPEYDYQWITDRVDQQIKDGNKVFLTVN